MTPIIVVTGANGFLGFQIVQQLAEAGHATRAIVHSERSATRLKEVLATAMFSGLFSFAYVPGNFASKIVFEDSFRGAVAVIHVASPIFEVGKLTETAEDDFTSPPGMESSTQPARH